MQTLRRSILFQLFLFIAFLIYGLHHIFSGIIPRDTTYGIILLVFILLVVGGGVTWFLLTPKEALVMVKPQDTNLTKISMYAIALGLVVGIIGSFIPDFTIMLNIVNGSIIALSSCLGIYVSAKILIDQNI